LFHRPLAIIIIDYRGAVVNSFSKDFQLEITGRARGIGRFFQPAKTLLFFYKYYNILF
jgi:hypothetical protein